MSLDALKALHLKLDRCRRCPKMIRPVVHGPALDSRVMLIGQAPGPREGAFGHPFAWTAGKTMFGWFEQALGVDEATVRQRLYIAAVARCFPGKAKGGGDRRPDETEMQNCRPWLVGEVAALRPQLVVPIGALAIEQVLQRKGPLVQFIGQRFQTRYHSQPVDVVALPHPSGASTWHRSQPGRGLLQQALKLLAAHPVMRAALE